MWVMFAFGSALFAGITAVLSKIGMQDMDSDVGTAVRTGVVLVFSWMMVFLTGSIGTIGEISGRTFLFLVLSGLATGASWLFYFRALQLGNVNKVAPIDKSSTVLTMLLAFLILGETLSLLKVVCMILIGAGTGENWNSGCGVQFGDRDPHLRGAGDGVASGVRQGQAGGGPAYQREKRTVSGVVRAGHRGLLAVLLPGASGWTGQRGGAD